MTVRPQPIDEVSVAGAAGFVSEIFVSLQGEGLFVGERQLFFRTSGCSATCSWCDTVYSKVETPRCTIHGDVKRPLSNPITLETAMREIELELARHRSVETVAITGGEPLEQAGFVTAVAARLSNAGRRVYLETNGLHAEEFGAIAGFVDVVAMDIKVPSATGVDSWAEHEAFLRRIKGTRFDVSSGGEAGRFFAKLVVEPGTGAHEVEKAAALIAAAGRSIPLVLQPESGALLSRKTTAEDKKRFNRQIERYAGVAGGVLDDVRVIPQCHRILNVR